MNTVAVVGGGAAGLMAAFAAAKAGSSVILIEKNERFARKVMITGKGRCNVTNNSPRDTLIANVPRNGRFLYSAFSEFSAQQVMEFFEKNGVPLKTERGNRVFPVSDKAVNVVDALVNAAKKAGVVAVHTAADSLLIEDGTVRGVKLVDGNEIVANRVILATGGRSYPVTGSTGDGYRMAEQAGHTIVPIKPSLVPLEAHEGFCSKLSGLSLKNITLSVYAEGKKKPIFSELGELLFTHFGVSGPLILSASAHIKDPETVKYTAVIDLKPALQTEQLDKRILRDFEAEQNRDFVNALDALLPKSLIPVIVSLSGIDPHQKVNQISREQRGALVTAIKQFTLHITRFRPIDEAVITSGGVSVKEINPSTMASKLVNGLYFAGELIDVDAYTGGFNLQIAFSTGYLAGIHAGGQEE